MEWIVDCNYGQAGVKSNKSCAVDLNDLGMCGRELGYGYHHGSPCIFIKLNKIVNWQPEFLTLSELASSGLSSEYLESLIDRLEERHPAYLKSIWVECRGRHTIDRVHLGSITYYPERGFPYFYFPYKTEQLFYLEPIVAVKFENPESE